MRYEYLNHPLRHILKDCEVASNTQTLYPTQETAPTLISQNSNDHEGPCNCQRSFVGIPPTPPVCPTMLTAIAGSRSVERWLRNGARPLAPSTGMASNTSASTPSTRKVTSGSGSGTAMAGAGQAISAVSRYLGPPLPLLMTGLM